jgi:transcriptional regulator with XRE-family HTH domain
METESGTRSTTIGYDCQAPSMIGAAQIKAARALLGLDQRELSELADVGISTLKRIELATEVTGSARSLWKIERALERAGVEFIAEEAGRGPGVRLRRPQSKRL